MQPEAARGKGESHRRAKWLYECTHEPEDAITSEASGLHSRSQPRGAAGVRNPGGLKPILHFTFIFI